MSDEQVVTISFVRYRGWGNRWWAFKQMGLAAENFQQVPGLQFFKMLGSGGGNGFSIWPNLGVYGLLSVWDNEASARQFLADHPAVAAIRQTADEVWTVFMCTFMAHGAWDKVSPFVVNAKREDDAPVGVITRATIYTKYLWRFWRFVPRVSRSVEGREGLLFSVGIGELPLVQQATFSLWKNSHAMKAYAYQSEYHREVVKRTRELGWYEEELFARFKPYATQGSWYGKDPLADYISGNHGTKL